MFFSTVANWAVVFPHFLQTFTIIVVFSLRCHLTNQLLSEAKMLSTPQSKVWSSNWCFSPQILQKSEGFAVMMMTKNTGSDCDWPEKHDISRSLCSPCFALLSLESTNHRTVLLPLLGLMGNFLLYLFFIRFVFLLSCFHLLLVLSILTPPTCLTFALWCHHYY